MNNEKFLLVKLLSGKCDFIIDRVSESYKGEEKRYYNLNGNDKDVSSVLDKDDIYKIAFIITEEKEKAYIGNEIYFGEAQINSKENLEFNIVEKVKSQLVISNFLEHLGLDLERDFDENSYLSIETSMNLYKQLEFSVKGLYEIDIEDIYKAKKKYKEIPAEEQYHKLSQKNQYCRRYIGKQFTPSDELVIRGEFQRDRERIIHAKSMRRLVDKAQIFTSTKGDHFRTRMTHTLEVTQIARGICSNLNLHNELVEAIALAHDIGHTPFGHQGERTLNSILKNEVKIIKNCDELKMGGFKHSFQGIRVLSHLEEKYLDFDGLDVSYQVLEGVLKHTNIQKEKDCENCLKCNDKKCFNIDEFLVNGDKDKLFLEYTFPTTLEGQIVSIADEIAQRGHDLDDALASNHLSISELLEICNIKKMEKIRDVIKVIIRTESKLKEKNRVFIDENDIKRSRIVSGIVTFFINDVTKASRLNIEKYMNSGNDFFEKNNRVDEQIIDFSVDGKFILKYLEKVINKKVINSFDVSRFDGKSGKIVEKLFKAYYENIMILPDGTLKRIYLDIRKFSNNVIDFRDGDINIVREEINKICNADLEEFKDKDEYIEYYKKRRVIVRNIVDQIAGMTDNFAISEYKKIYDIT